MKHLLKERQYSLSAGVFSYYNKQRFLHKIQEVKYLPYGKCEIMADAIVKYAGDARM